MVMEGNEWNDDVYGVAYRSFYRPKLYKPLIPTIYYTSEPSEL